MRRPPPEDRTVTDDPVAAYLQALGAQDWDALRATLAPDVTREGPYGDDVTGADAYVEFLRATFTSLERYRLEVHRTFGGGGRVCVELAETATVAERRVRTEEAVVFAVSGERIELVRVFLQRSVSAD